MQNEEKTSISNIGNPSVLSPIFLHFFLSGHCSDMVPSTCVEYTDGSILQNLYRRAGSQRV